MVFNKELEISISHLISCYFYKGIIPKSVVQKLPKILKTQKNNTDTEIGGSIFSSNHGLEFMIVNSQYSIDLKEALNKFEKGDYTDVNLLSEYAEVIKETHGKYLSYENLDMAILRITSNVMKMLKCILFQKVILQNYVIIKKIHDISYANYFIILLASKSV